MLDRAAHQIEGAIMIVRKLMLLTLATVLAITSAQSAPSLRGTPPPTDLSLVQWHHRGYGWGWNPLAWFGLGVGVVAGSIIADEAYRPHPGHYYDEGPYDGPYYYPAAYRGDPREICAQNFRTFEWRTGYYTTYGGERRLCPYLRSDGPPAEAPPPHAPY